MKRYGDERSKNIILFLLAKRKMLINLKKKHFRQTSIIRRYVAEYCYAFFYSELKSDHTVGVRII